MVYALAYKVDEGYMILAWFEHECDVKLAYKLKEAEEKAYFKIGGWINETGHFYIKTFTEERMHKITNGEDGKYFENNTSEVGLYDLVMLNYPKQLKEWRTHVIDYAQTTMETYQMIDELFINTQVWGDKKYNSYRGNSILKLLEDSIRIQKDILNDLDSMIQTIDASLKRERIHCIDDQFPVHKKLKNDSS